MTREEFEKRVDEIGDKRAGRELFFVVFPEIFDDDPPEEGVFRKFVMGELDLIGLVGIGSSTNYWVDCCKAHLEGKNYNVVIPFEDVFEDRTEAERYAFSCLRRFFDRGRNFFCMSGESPIFSDMESWDAEGR
jgi:hypothetical protein